MPLHYLATEPSTCWHTGSIHIEEDEYDPLNDTIDEWSETVAASTTSTICIPPLSSILDCLPPQPYQSVK